MREFYCDKCNENALPVDGKCPKCGNSLGKNLNPVDDENDATNDYYDSTDSDIIMVYKSFINYADWAKAISILCAIIITIISLVSIGFTKGMSILLLPMALIIVLRGCVLAKHFKWKAYMLQTNYQISNKRKK